MGFLSFLLGALIGSAAMWFFVQEQCSTLKRENDAQRKELGMLRKELAEVEECGQGLERFVERQQAKKEAAKGKIITALRAKVSLRNEEIAELAGISSATVVRYMDELEKEGKVAQVGKTGRSVVYGARG